MVALHFERKTLAELIAGELSGRIVRGDLRAGERLPSERDLAKTYGTNRNTLREAIRMLQTEGLIRVRHGSGAVVLDFRRHGQLSLLPHLLQAATDPAESARELLDLGAFRRVVLTETAALAAARAGSEDKAELRVRLDDIRTAYGGELLDSIRCDLAFYRALADAAHSHVVRWAFNTFSGMYEQALDVVARFWVFPDRYLESLETLVGAIAERRPEEARSTLSAHLARSDELITPINPRMNEGGET